MREAGYDERELNVSQQEYDQEAAGSGEQTQNIESESTTSNPVGSESTEKRAPRANTIARTPRKNQAEIKMAI